MDQAAADKVKQIREYLSKMTPGPWEHNDEQTSDRGHYTPPEIFSVADEAALRIVCRLAVGRNEDHDGPGIAALRTDAEWLLSQFSASEERVRKLTSELADMKDDLKEIRRGGMSWEDACGSNPDHEV